MSSSSIATKWLNLELKNPIVLGAISPISHTRIKEQVNFYANIEKSGAAAIVIGSSLPFEWNNRSIKVTQNDLIPLSSGLTNKKQKDDTIGFALIGPPVPNLRSINFGISLIEEAKKKIKIPIIGSIANLGTEELFIDAAVKMAKAGADALELNFSCPNIISLTLSKNKKFQSIPLSLDVIKNIKNKTKLPISIKLPPNYIIQSLLGKDNPIDSLTCFNAYSGLMPPTLTPPFSSPFGRCHFWSYSGIYGSFVRFFTYKTLVEFKKNSIFADMQISVVGGLYHPDHVIEALLLGADTIQLASGILFKKLNLINSCIKKIKAFMSKNNFKNIDDFRGISLKYIANHPLEIFEYQNIHDSYGKTKKSNIKTENKNFKQCANPYCMALQQIKGRNGIDLKLCSGCGWCKFLSKKGLSF